MKVHILDDWFDTLRGLPCYAKLEGHDVTVWTDHEPDPAALAERVQDAEALVRMQILPSDRIIGVETGGCPHTAIREDASINLAAVAEMSQRHADLDLVLIESGGDNLSATFSPELADVTIYVIDVAAGEEIPRKGGPAITRSDLLIINKTDLAPHVGASLEVMERDATRMRAGRPFVFAALRHGQGVEDIILQIRALSGLGMTTA